MHNQAASAAQIVSLETLENQPFEVFQPPQQTVPLVFSSPHSGRMYPEPFLDASRLDLHSLRRSEDFFVDQLFPCVCDHGIPFLVARFPRVFVDPNREPYELDPHMFEGALPAFANTRSVRVSGGLGTLARIVSDGSSIYRTKLSFPEAQARIQKLYMPYHRQLAELLRLTREKFGYAILIDCHSMPSANGPYDHDEGTVTRADFILGDRFGTSCAPVISRTIDRCLSNLSYRVTRNNPYAGGYVTDHYGRPNRRVHALQIEINRKLYMDERALAPTPAMLDLRADLDRFVAHLVSELPQMMAPLGDRHGWQEAAE